MSININKATVQDLQDLGFTPEWAKYIIDYREYLKANPLYPTGFVSANDFQQMDLPADYLKMLVNNVIFSDSSQPASSVSSNLNNLLGSMSGNPTVSSGDSSFNENSVLVASKDPNFNLDEKFEIDLQFFNVPTSIINDLRVRNMTVQKVEDGYASINKDFYTLKISILPKVNGIQSIKVLGEYIRIHLNDFIDTDLSSFSTYGNGVPGSGVDDNWISSNPLGAVLKIDIKGPDDAAVVVSNFINNKDKYTWIFSTIKTPDTGEHPISGNREFGIITNTDRSYTFFTRAVDRFTDPLTFELILFAKAQQIKLWSSLMDKVNDFVNNNGGSSKNEIRSW